LLHQVGISLENITLEQLGRAERVVVTKDSTTILTGSEHKSAIESRIKQIRFEIDNTDNKFDKEKVRKSYCDDVMSCDYVVLDLVIRASGCSGRRHCAH
jgi:chaperonin GroEL (HSP60 family)